MTLNYRGALNQMDRKHQLPASNGSHDYASKTDNSETSFHNDNDSSSVSKHKDSLELKHNVQIGNGTECQETLIPVENNAGSTIPNIGDFTTGAARNKITPLKGLSSTLKPRLLKSIGIQVGPDKW